MNTLIITGNGLKMPSASVTNREKQNGDTDDEDEEDRIESNAVSSSVADLCSATHEFEWLSSPGFQDPYTEQEKQNENSTFADLSSNQQQNGPLNDQSSQFCQGSPASSQHRNSKTNHVKPRRTSDIIEHARMSPNPYSEMHGCRQHLSPMRSSWCCPSQRSHSMCMHHSANVTSGMEIVPYNYQCYGSDINCSTYQTCNCLPPTGLPHSHRYPESHNWCRNTSPHHELIRRDTSPCGMHRSCQSLGTTNRSRSSRKRDCSPSILSPRCYSPVTSEHIISHRPSNQEQWQAPLNTEDLNSLQRVQELENEKKNLILQASVLADQVEVQTEKLHEMDRLLDKKKDELICLEKNLHQEVLARSAVENNKLELMTELSNLRLRLTAAERDRKESDDMCRKLENEIHSLHSHLSSSHSEYSSLKKQLSPEAICTHLNNEKNEVESLRSALDCVILSNDDKDQKINDLRSSLTKYKKLQDIVLSNHSNTACNSSTDAHIDSDILHASQNDSLHRKVDDVNLASSSALSTTTPVHCISNSTKITSPPSHLSSLYKSNSAEDIGHPYQVLTDQTSLYSTMPRQTSNHVLHQLQLQLKEKTPSNGNSSKEELLLQRNITGISNKNTANASPKSSGVSFAEVCITIPLTEPEIDENSISTNSPPFLIKGEKDKKGLFKFFSKWKRSGSQNIDKVDGDFKRGGIRATTGPRWGWTRDILQEPGLSFNEYSTDMVADWLHSIGLSMYASECKRSMVTGDKLLKASSFELEKELGVKNPVHRKKILLAIKSFNKDLDSLPTAINNLDYQWVVRWLDDIGLPQYKDSFADARVDGRMLHFLTVDDLLYLKVVNQLHHISIRSGIQVLRMKSFDSHCLVRRSIPDENKVYSPELVALWTNHRVMEWLRTVDLSEYAPNLRGSGVHGGLIVYEPKFNTNLFATLLNIPPTKTLLRRHLATHFKNIVGEDLTQIKREQETETPLSPSIKVKVVRKNQFAIKKKRNKIDFENEDYVCPLDVPVTIVTARQSETDKLIVRRNSDPSPQDQRFITINRNIPERMANLPKEASYGGFQDENLNDAPTTIV